MSVVGEVVPLALGIALSPFPVLPAILLLFTPRPRATAGAFLGGWASGILTVTAAGTALAAVIESTEETPTWAAWTKIVLGAVLLALAARQWRSRSAGGTPAWMQALTGTTPAKATRLGLLLATANPKALLLAAAAGLAIGAADLGPAPTTAAVLAFTVIAISTVALPLLLHLALGTRILAPLGSARTWLETHNAAVTSLVLALIGALLIADGATAI